MKSSGSTNDTSASANASPEGVNKHEHPPTPTIEEQLINIVFGEPQPEHIWQLGTKKAYYEVRAKEPQIAALTLLITKAEQTLLDDLTVSFVRMNNDEFAKHLLMWKNRTIDPSQLKATTQPSYSPAPGTDGDT